MQRLSAIPSGLFLVGLLLLASCHDAPRKNPFDPELTPPVELSVALDDTAGTATLTWTPYAGEASFAEYRVLRKVQGLEVVDTLAVIDEVGQTSFVDSTLAQHTTYVYRVSTVNASGFEVTSDDQAVLPMQLPGVRIVSADFDSRTATATLEWMPYAGDGFGAYQVRRWTEELAPEVVFETAQNTVTSFVDSGLVGAIEYFYRVVVVTDRSEEVSGEEIGGGFHQLLATWPLPGEFAQLVAEPDGRIAALVGIRDSVTPSVGIAKLIILDPEAGWVEEQELLKLGWPFDVGAGCLSIARGSDGRRFLSAGQDGCAVLAFTLEGELIWKGLELFPDAFPASFDRIESTVSGTVWLWGNQAVIADVRVWDGDEMIFSDDFSHFEGAWAYRDSLPGWDVGSDVKLAGGQGMIILELDNPNTPLDGSNTISRRLSPSPLDFRLDVDMSWWLLGNWAKIIIQVGENPFSLFRLTLQWRIPEAVLEWSRSSIEEADLEAREGQLTVLFPFYLVEGAPWRASMEVADGQPSSVTISSPIIWNEAIEEPAAVSSDVRRLAVLEDRVLLTADRLAYSIDATGAVSAAPPFEAWVSEIRVWDDPDGTKNVGVCMPEANRLQLGKLTATQARLWSSGLRTELGPFLGEEAGFMSHPLSFDIGPDGRIYVLEAGSSRVLVFDEERNFLTQWGRKGSGRGEFDLGDGTGWGFDWDSARDFQGSIAVDDEGYIYVADVADVGNQRIQKFAP